MDKAAQLIQRQLDAYNARDIDALLATYAADAYAYPGQLLASGHAQLRQRLLPRLAEPDLHAELLRRTVLGELVIDEEVVTRNFAAGRGRVYLTMIYRVRDGLIQDASVLAGAELLD